MKNCLLWVVVGCWLLLSAYVFGMSGDCAPTRRGARRRGASPRSARWQPWRWRWCGRTASSPAPPPPGTCRYDESARINYFVTKLVIEIPCLSHSDNASSPFYYFHKNQQKFSLCCQFCKRYLFYLLVS